MFTPLILGCGFLTERERERERGSCAEQGDVSFILIDSQQLKLIRDHHVGDVFTLYVQLYRHRET